MKKLVLFAAVAFAATMVSCGGNKSAEEAQDAANEAAVEVVEEVAAVVDSIAPDSVAVDTVAAVAEAVVE